MFWEQGILSFPAGNGIASKNSIFHHTEKLFWVGYQYAVHISTWPAHKGANRAGIADSKVCWALPSKVAHGWFQKLLHDSTEFNFSGRLQVLWRAQNLYCKQIWAMRLVYR
jgi:hypothetical protein